MKNKISKNTILFTIICFFIFCGSLNKYLALPSLLLSFFAGIFISINALKNKDENIPFCILILLCFQNFFIGTGAHLAGTVSTMLKLMTQIPFIVLFVNWLLIIIFKKDEIPGEKAFFVFLFMILLSLFIGRGKLASIILNIRNMTTFYMSFVIGYYHLSDKEKLDSFVEKLFKLSTIMLVAGIILYFGGYNLYKFIGIDEVYYNKLGILINYLDNRFYTTLITHRFMRMGSLMYEPVNLAYFFSGTFLMSLFYPNKNKLRNIIINGIGLILTFGKGGYLLTGFVIGFVVLSYYLSKIVKNKNINKISDNMIIVTVIFTSLFCVFYYLFIGAAATTHFVAIVSTFKSVLLKPFGYGLGTGGNYALSTFVTGDEWMSAGGETAFMSFFYQLGIQGIIVLLIIFNKLRISKVDETINGNQLLDLTFKILPIALLFISLLQDNTFTPQCIVLFMFLQGAMKCVYDKEESQ